MASWSYADGTLLRERRVGINGLEDKAYKDIAVASDGRTLLIADSEGYLWHEESARLTVHFCIEPGFVDCTDDDGALIDQNGNGVCDWDECIDASGALIDTNGDAICDWQQCTAADGSVTAVNPNTGTCASGEPQPIPEPRPEPIEQLVQKNDALAVVGDSILAAPRYYDVQRSENKTLVEASLRSYALATGAPMQSIDLTRSGLELSGLTATTDGFFAVSGNQLLDLDDSGDVRQQLSLDGVDAVGVAAVGDELLVLDGATKRILAYQAP